MSSWFSGSAVVLLCLASLPAAGQTASLLRDIGTESFFRSSSDPSGLHSVRGKVFFAATELSTGIEMWASDGSVNGTEMLADACPGDCSASPYGLGSVGGTFLWATDPFDNREEIWRSDGTRAGTYSLNPPESGLDLFEETDFSSRELKYAVTDRALVFRACTFDLGCELWSTDGTLEGTRLVKDITPGLASSRIDIMIAAGDRVFFFIPKSSHEWTLGVTDGTEAGTVTMPVVGSAPLRSLVALGSRIFFLLTLPGAGEELWTSDGTPAGTRVLTQLAPAQPFSSPDDHEDPRLMPAGGKVYFVADDGTHGRELWTSDGTPAGTRRITDFNYDQPFPDEDAGPFVAEVEGDRVVFVATDGVTLQKLWTTRGTAETLAALPDPCKGACQFLPEFPRLFEVGPRVLFVGNDGPHGQELWATDGTAAGTRMVRDLCPGTCSPFFISELIPLPGVLVFTGSPTPSPQHFEEVWRSDGTAAGTVQISHHHFGFLEEAVLAGRNLFLAREELWVSTDRAEPRRVTYIGRGEPSSNPTGFTAFHGLVYFAASGDSFGQEREIWQTDGTREGTVQLTNPGGPDVSTPVTDPVAAGAYLFYVRLENNEEGALWRTDGTAAGTIPLVQEALQGRRARRPTAFQDKIYFFATAEALGHYELWRSDGTSAGTTKIVDLPAELDPRFLTAVGNDLYFVADRFGSSRGIWRLDGGTGAVAKIADVPWFPNDDPRFTRAGSRVFFLAVNRLWVTDGTPAGTAAVLPDDGPPATDLAELGGKLYFRSFARELWRTDGTVAGTVLLKVFTGLLPPPQLYQLPRLLSSGGRLWLAGSDGVHGIEPWTSDGTTLGTVLLRDVYPGLKSSLPQGFAAAEGRVFFSAMDSLHGNELWQSDGTEAGTRMVQDIAPGSLPARPVQMTALGDRLYFSAIEESAGREPWVLPLAGPASCQPSPTRLCLNGGRFAVEVRWRDFQDNIGAGQAVALTADTGYFWFFSSSNVEAVVKVLDGRGLNNYFWVFYGALSNVEYTLVVTDTATGLSRQYYNPPGQLASAGDTRGFGLLGAFSRSGPAKAGPVLLPLTSERIDPAAAGAPCQPAPRRLCLGNGRFAVETAWKDFQGNTGNGTATTLSADTGWFWFFDDDNVEVIVKVLDGTPVNGKHWVFYGALSNVEYTVTVTDTQTGKIKTYRNPSGRFASVADTSAF